jgi:hypothetical protein
VNYYRYARNVHSQCGEDGILEALLQRLPDVPRWSVEFGAGDGLEFSNTAHLAEQGWECVMIEADTAKAAACQLRHPRTIEAIVGWQGADRLDAILALHCAGTLPREFGVLSVDIDGNDFWAWEAVREYRPRIVLVEFNPTMPPWQAFVQQADPELNLGCSLRALVQLGHAKDYELAAATGWNAIFVTGDDFPALGIEDNSIDRLWTVRTSLAWTWYGYDGSRHDEGLQACPWVCSGGRYAGALPGKEGNRQPDGIQ